MHTQQQKDTHYSHFSKEKRRGRAGVRGVEGRGVHLKISSTAARLRQFSASCPPDTPRSLRKRQREDPLLEQKAVRASRREGGTRPV